MNMTTAWIALCVLTLGVFLGIQLGLFKGAERCVDACECPRVEVAP